MSHPSRVRGLKQKKLNLKSLKIRVAPLAGAWIETCKIKGRVEKLESHPSRVRGLKHPGQSAGMPPLRSHPSRVRGLKHLIGKCLCSIPSRTPRGCVD